MTEVRFIHSEKGGKEKKIPLCQEVQTRRNKLQTKLWDSDQLTKTADKTKKKKRGREKNRERARESQEIYLEMGKGVTSREGRTLRLGSERGSQRIYYKTAAQKNATGMRCSRGDRRKKREKEIRKGILQNNKP